MYKDKRGEKSQSREIKGSCESFNSWKDECL